MLILLFFLCLVTFAHDDGFRYKNGYCQKNGSPGFNTDFRGECGVTSQKNYKKKSWHNLSLRGFALNRSEFKFMTVSSSDLTGVSFNRGQILNSHFKNIKGHNIDLRATLVIKTQWEQSDLKNLVAMGAKIRMSNFTNCDLQNSSFWGAQLQEVDFQNTDLRGADFSQSFILFSKFKGAQFNNKTRLPFTQREALKRGMIKVD